MRITHLVLAGVILAQVVGCKLIDESDRDWKSDPSKSYSKVSLDRIMDNPSEFKDMDVEFQAIFNRTNEGVWQEIHAPFNERNHLSFSAWPGNARVYRLEERKHLLTTLFIQKSNGHLSEVATLHRYTLITVKGMVRSDYGGIPWIEVYRTIPVVATKPAKEVDFRQPVYSDDSLRSLIAGFDDAATGRDDSAVKNLTDALSKGVAQEAQLEACVMLGSIYEKQKEWLKAVQAYNRALFLDQDNATIRDSLARVKKLAEASGKAGEIEHHDTPVAQVEHDDKVAALQAQLEAAQKKHDQAVVDLEVARARVKELEARPASNPDSEKQIQELKQSLEAKSAEADAAKKKAVDAESARTASEKDLANTNAKLAATNQKLQETEVARKAAENKMTDAAANATKLANELEVVKAELKKYTSGTPDADALAKLKADLKANEDKLKGLQDENARLKMEKIEDVEKRVRGEYDEQLKKLNNTIKALRKENDELYKEKKAGIEK